MYQLTQSLKELQATWYKILKENGFEDIEDESIGGFELMPNGQTSQAIDGGRPLKHWSGVAVEAIDQNDGSVINVIDLHFYQEPLKDLQSTSPTPLLIQEQRLLNHPQFDKICENICWHGNHTLNKLKVRKIWELYLDGKTNRAIGSLLKINHILVFRTIKELTKWAEFEND